MSRLQLTDKSHTEVNPTQALSVCTVHLFVLPHLLPEILMDRF